MTVFKQRAKMDKSLKGIKRFYKNIQTLKVADEIIKNTYCKLMRHEMECCYIYCEDMWLQTYFKEKLGN